MPKLRKHSHFKENEAEVDDTQPSQSVHSRQQQDSRSLLDVPLATKKMKYRERVALITKFESKVKPEPEQRTTTNTPLAPEDRKADDIDMGNYLSKFKEDDDFSTGQLNSTRAKKKKPGIRVSNKFFTDHNFEGELEELPAEQLELVVERKETKNPDYLLAKVERRAEGIKNRLDFKNIEQDHKLKNDMKDKLRSIEGCEEVSLVIEVPQVAAANKHIDGALFLKNVRAPSDGAVVLEEDESEDFPKDRKVFYENLSKKMKMKRAETLTESVLKQCFKKSRLDNGDFLHDFNNHEEYIQDSKIKRDSRLSGKQPSQSQVNETDVPLESAATSKQGLVNHKIEQVVLTQVVHAQQKEEIQKNQEQKPSAQKEDSNADIAKSKPKKRRGRGRGRAKRFNVKDLIEEQAEDSDQDGLVKHKADNQEEKSDEDDDCDLSSLIDNEVTLCEEEEELAHRQFIKDMIETEEQNFARLQRRVYEQHRHQEEQLRQRMQAAGKRNAIKQKVEQHTESKPHPPSQNSDESISNVKNLEKLKQLEVQLGITKTKPDSQSNPGSSHDTVNKKIADFEKLMSLQTVNLRKPISTGLKNVKKFKSKPKQKMKLKN